ncbi:MAG: carbohydrate binding family 9 domain-containing protein, partial [Vicinamibacterales bacterium]
MPVFLFFVVVFLGVAPAARAQGPRPEINAVRLLDADTIVVDGLPDEAVWKRATPATNFLQRDPDNGEPASERTEVRVVFDEDRIILGVTLFDSEPDRLLGNQMQRDQPFSADDRFMWSIDTFLDGRSGYFFEINPSGAMGDGLITGPTGGGFGGEMIKSWDGIWIARVRRGSIGWTAEIEIPFKTLNFDPNTTAWGANFQRTVKRKNEESLWTGWLRNEGLTRMSNAGRVNGIQDISQGLGLDLKPYGLGAAGNAPGRGDSATTGDVDFGLDAFYNVTPALKANFTVNTDFAETEVDQRRTNLTRFPLFFQIG